MALRSLEHFFDACGADGHLQICVESIRQPASVQRELSAPFALVGRHPSCNIVINHSKVSRRHVYLQIIDGRLCWVDLTSGHSKWGWLQVGHGITVGPAAIRLCSIGSDLAPCESFPAPDFNPLASGDPREAALPRVVIELMNGTEQCLAWPMNRVLALIGRARSCKVQLVDDSVSRVHCSLLRTPAGVWVVDLAGRGGVLVNGVVAPWALLEDGDELLVGKVRIRTRYESAVPVSPGAAHVMSIDNPPRSRRPESASRAVVHPTRDSAALILPVGVPEQRIANPKASAARDGFGSLVVRDADSTTAGPIACEDGRVDSVVSEKLLASILYHLTFAQQKMFEQNHQAMRLMVQMLRTLCRDQVVLVRDELGRLDQLTDEMRVVQFQLADLGQLPAVEAPRPSTNYTTRVESPTSLAPSAERNEIPKETVPVKTSGTSDDAQNGEVVAPGDPHGKERQEQVAPPAPSTAEETHLWLCERLAAIQIERQGLWERILNTVSSKIGGILL